MKGVRCLLVTQFHPTNVSILHMLRSVSAYTGCTTSPDKCIQYTHVVLLHQTSMLNVYKFTTSSYKYAHHCTQAAHLHSKCLRQTAITQRSSVNKLYHDVLMKYGSHCLPYHKYVDCRWPILLSPTHLPINNQVNVLYRLVV